MGEVRRRHQEKAIRRNNSAISNGGRRKEGGQNNVRQYVLLVIVLAAAALFYIYRLKIHSSTQYDVLRKSDLPSALVEDIYNETSWGTYRPHLYFGMRTKHPESPLFGLMWYRQPKEPVIRSLPIRHWCEHGDDVNFSWLAHDGRTFGRQQVVDRHLRLQIDWIQTGQRSWSARLSGNDEQGNASHALVFYLALKGMSNNRLIPRNQMMGDSYAFLLGSSPQLGQFKMDIHPPVQQQADNTETISHVAYAIPSELDMRDINQLVLASLARPPNGQLELVLRQNERIPGAPGDGANFVAVQFTVKGKFDLKLDFMADGDEVEENVDQLFSNKLAEFDAKFRDTFPIDFRSSDSPKSDDSQKYEKVAKSALASLLGGIGIWHGHALVRANSGGGKGDEQVFPYGPLSLLSAVPSRPFFPRGFLWDEGFHSLAIRQFDPHLSLQIFGSWLDIMNSAGWIPREVILGEEAQAKVPAEFLVQNPAVANPPMFFYALEKIVRDTEQLKRHYHQIGQLYPRLKQFYIWLRTTQQGPQPGTMQWQGRNRTTERELNPKNLASGLDDFPRATHPSPDEYHLDLRCWIAFSCRVLRQLAEMVGDSAWVPVVEEDLHLFTDQDGLDRLHWSERKQRYADFGLHSERVQLVQKLITNKGGKRGAQGQPEQQERIFVRKTMEEPRLRLVDDVFGYVNLFPLLLRLLSPNNAKLGILLQSMNKTEDLWTPYGLRSLSTKSTYYLARNTEHDPPYWRGAIWININYLALDALQHYAHSGGPHARLAGELYAQLRVNLVQNIAEQYERTGFFWEHYSDKTGEGMGTKPFTGWTSLVLNILAEKYD